MLLCPYHSNLILTFLLPPSLLVVATLSLLHYHHCHHILITHSFHCSPIAVLLLLLSHHCSPVAALIAMILLLHSCCCPECPLFLHSLSTFSHHSLTAVLLLI